MGHKAIIEIEKGSHLKYEIKNGRLKLDRIIKTPYPYMYGYIPGTLAKDGDALDVFIISQEYIIPTTEVEVTILGVIEMTDSGEEDHKVVAMLKGEDDFTGGYLRYEIDKIKYFLSTYKKGTIVGEFVDAKEAAKLIKECKSRFLKQHI